MVDADIKSGALARICKVNVKTVDRWLREDGRVPHAQQRWAVSKALGVDPDMIWPSLKQVRRTGPEREITAAYPTRSAMPSTVWVDAIGKARVDLTFAGYTSYFLWLTVPSLRDVLRAKAEAGARIRFLLGDPESEVTRRREADEAVSLTISSRIAITMGELEHLRGLPNVEARYSDRHISLSVWQFDDEAIICTHIASLVGHDSPTYRLKRLETGGMFNAYASHVDALWADARSVWG
jgi:lambda repressor-like predicted transcriptional regulator